MVRETIVRDGGIQRRPTPLPSLPVGVILLVGRLLLLD